MEFKEQLKILCAAKEIVLYGNSAISAIIKTALQDMGIKTCCRVFDMGSFVEGDKDIKTYGKKRTVILCSARFRTRESMRRDCDSFFSGAHIVDFFEIYYEWITQIVKRECNPDELMDTIEHWKNEDDIIMNIDSINTLYCNLNCKECSNGIQYRKKRIRISAKEQVYYLKKILKFMPVAECNFQGGEVFTDVGFADFLYKHSLLPRIALFTIATNATILPEDETFRQIRKIGAMIRISDYGSLSIKKDAIIEKCKEYHIPFLIFPKVEKWRKFGEYKKRGRTEEELRKISEECCFGTHDLMFVQNKMYCCLRALFGSVFEEGEDIRCNMVDLDTDFSKEDLMEIVNGQNLWRMCDYCDYPMEIVEPAEQM